MDWDRKQKRPTSDFVPVACSNPAEKQSLFSPGTHRCTYGLLQTLNYPRRWLKTATLRRLVQWRFKSTHSLRLHRGMWMASFMSRRLYRGHTTVDGRWIEGWVGPKAGMDFLEMRKLSCPDRKSKPDHRVVHRVIYTPSLVKLSLHLKQFLLIAV